MVRRGGRRKGREEKRRDGRLTVEPQIVEDRWGGEIRGNDEVAGYLFWASVCVIHTPSIQPFYKLRVLRHTIKSIRTQQ